MMTSDEKYQNDHTFYSLVNHFLSIIEQQQTSFAEVREAVLFAQIKYELSRPSQPIFLSPNLEEELRIRTRKYPEDK